MNDKRDYLCNGEFAVAMRRLLFEIKKAVRPLFNFILGEPNDKS